MVWMRCCPRCRGDLRDNSDIYGRYHVCVQCGYYLTDLEEALLRFSNGHTSMTTSNDTAEKIDTTIAGTP